MKKPYLKFLNIYADPKLIHYNQLTIKYFYQSHKIHEFSINFNTHINKITKNLKAKHLKLTLTRKIKNSIIIIKF